MKKWERWETLTCGDCRKFELTPKRSEVSDDGFGRCRSKHRDIQMHGFDMRDGCADDPACEHIDEKV